MSCWRRSWGALAKRAQAEGFLPAAGIIFSLTGMLYADDEGRMTRLMVAATYLSQEAADEHARLRRTGEEPA